MDGDLDEVLPTGELWVEVAVLSTMDGDLDKLKNLEHDLFMRRSPIYYGWRLR